MNKFAVFILTHGRAETTCTESALRNAGYTGKVFHVIDDEDKQERDYRKRFGDENIIKFCKQEWLDKSDTMDISGSRDVVLPARNACFDIAKERGIECFLQLDDDYTAFFHRQFVCGRMLSVKVKNFDGVARAYSNFMLVDKRIASIGFSLSGMYNSDYEGWNNSLWKLPLTSSFFLRTDSPVRFSGRLHEDVVANMIELPRGRIFAIIGHVMLMQGKTQTVSNKGVVGGLADAYAREGRYRLCWYPKIARPMSVMLSLRSGKVQFSPSYKALAPKILSERYRKQ